MIATGPSGITARQDSHLNRGGHYALFINDHTLFADR
jgi:hypothetical protein